MCVQVSLSLAHVSASLPVGRRTLEAKLTQVRQRLVALSGYLPYKASVSTRTVGSHARTIIQLSALVGVTTDGDRSPGASGSPQGSGGSGGGGGGGRAIVAVPQAQAQQQQQPAQQQQQEQSAEADAGGQSKRRRIDPPSSSTEAAAATAAPQQQQPPPEPRAQRGTSLGAAG